MSAFEFARLRGTIVAISTFFLIVSLYMILDQRPAAPTSPPADETPTTAEPTVGTTIPLDNRLCGLAQRVLAALPDNEPAIAQTMQSFYTEAASFTEGDLRGDLSAASRFYKELNDIGIRASWDVDRIVLNNDGARWKALLTGTPTGVEESRQAIRDRCRVSLPPAPFIDVDRSGRIQDQRLAKMLEPVDREIHRAPEPEPESSETGA